MAIPVGKTDKVEMFLDYADDRMEVYVNENSVGFINLGDEGKSYDLGAHFRPGMNTVRVHGIDTQPTHRALKFHVTVAGKKVWDEELRQPSTGPYPNHWYDKIDQFEVAR